MNAETCTLILGNRVYSSWSLRGWLLARQAGIAFDEVMIPLRTPDTARLIRQHSPSGKVPTLVDGSLAIWDSLAIAEYLAEKFPDAGIWPADSVARAVARCVSAEMHSGFQALRQAWPMNLRRTGPKLVPSDAVAADIARIVAIWADCRARFGHDDAFLFGAWSAADAFYAPVVTRFASFGADLDTDAAAYCRAVVEHPWMREWAGGAAKEAWTIPDIDAI